jgi:hypothetical protein
MRMAPGSTLGCVACRHAGVQPPRTPTRCGSLVTRDAARGVTAVAINDTRTLSVHADRSAGEAHGDGELKDMKGPSAASRRGAPKHPG